MVGVNGIMRGKWIPAKTAGKVFTSGMRMPFSLLASDVWGQDVLEAGFITETGDNDGICKPVSKKPYLVPWLPGNTAQVLMSVYDEKGRPFFADPRHILAGVLAEYKKMGLTPVVAAELEFYLIDNRPDDLGRPQPPLNPRTGVRAYLAHAYNLDEQHDFRAVFSDIYKSCEEQDIPADAMISETGPAQFEINLVHQADALAAADHAMLFKRTVRGVAQKHDMMATFMAKPFADMSGSGMHIHFSILDKKGRNIFEGRDDKGSPALKHAIAGLLKHMPASIAVLAPNANSYRRFRVGTHAPTTMTWGYDNRSASLRVPQSDLDATRIEYRVAGADASPHLALAVILAAALDGLKARKNPPPASKGDAYAVKGKSFPVTWDEALNVFEKSAFIDKYIGKAYKKVYMACKRQEKMLIEAQVSSVEYDAYLRDV